MSRLHDDRVRRRTSAAVLQRIDAATLGDLSQFPDADAQRVSERMAALEREWDTDRTIELESSLTALLGLALGAFVRRPFLAIPAVVGSAVFLHAMTGWYPLLPVFRRMGLRSTSEIARERYALKALRGDFSGLGERRAQPRHVVQPMHVH